MTKTHVIDGITYEEVARKAKVGEKVIIVGNEMCHDFPNGYITTVTRLDDEDNEAVAEGYYLADEEARDYRVLVPVKDATPAAPESDADIIANLTRRVFALENARTADGALLIEAFSALLRKRDERIDTLEARLDDAKVTI